LTAATARQTEGFTLVEMMVTIFIISLLAGIALPTIAALFGSGTEEQACNILSAQLRAARSVAIRNATYAGVHVQLADDSSKQNTGLLHVSFAAVVWDDPATPGHQFTLAPDFRPERVPGTVAFGKINSTFVSGGNYRGLSGSDDLRSFTTFTIVFSPTGKVVRQVAGGNVVFDATDALFAESQIKLWDRSLTNDNTGLSGETAVTLFDIKKFIVLREQNDAEAYKYLNENGMFLPVSVHTGQLLPRE